MKIIEQKAKDIKPGETIFDGDRSFIIKEVRVDAERGWTGIAFIDTRGVWHGFYHADEYLGVGEELARNQQMVQDIYRLANTLSEMIH